MDSLLNSQGHLPISKIRGYESRKQLYGIVKVTGGEVEPKTVMRKLKIMERGKLHTKVLIVIGEILCRYGEV